jgi:hypothetical protein
MVAKGWNTNSITLYYFRYECVLTIKSFRFWIQTWQPCPRIRGYTPEPEKSNLKNLMQIETLLIQSYVKLIFIHNLQLQNVEN